MKKIQGTHIHLGYMGGNTFTPFSFARQASIKMSRKMIQVASPHTGDSEEYIPGRKSWKMDCGCLLSSDVTTVYNAYKHGTKLNVYFRDETPDYSPEPKHAFNGFAYIDSLKQQGNIHDMASFSISLQGTGKLEYDVWEGEIVQIGISENPISESTENSYRVNLNTPAPCDIKLYYPGDTRQPTINILIQKGETFEGEYSRKKASYSFEKWVATPAVANHTVTLEDL